MENNVQIIKFESNDTNVLDYSNPDYPTNIITVDDLTILPNSISYKYNNIILPFDIILKQYESAEALIEQHYPVYSIIESRDPDYDPNNFLPGVWVRFCEGRIGISAADTELSLIEMSIGEYSHQLNIAELPSHRHAIGVDSETIIYKGTSSDDVGEGSNPSDARPTLSTGGNVPHNNIMPYIVVFKWKRVS